MREHGWPGHKMQRFGGEIISEFALYMHIVLGNNLYALILIVVISGEDAPTTGSTGAAQRIRLTGSTKTT